jgi:glycosyltransferase involved in cell wall biosynthesis
MLPRDLKSNYRIIFIGNGSVTKEFLKIKEKEDYERELKSKVDDYNLKEKVLFTGAIDRDSLMSAYKECDLVVLPSHQEGFGLAITEAMAFGKPVIGSAVGGIPTQIWPGVNGYIVKPNDPGAMAEAIDYILSNVGSSREMGENGKKIYQTNFSTERGVQDHLALYREVLTGA